MKNRIFVYVLFMIIVSILLTSCSTINDSAQVKKSLITDIDLDPISVINSKNKEEMASDIKKTVLSVDEIYDTALILGKEDCLVAIKVHHLQRFRMKKIEKELKEKLEKKFPDENFTVSSDFKIFLETVRLKEKADKDNLSEDEKEKQLQKIIKLSEEQA